MSLEYVSKWNWDTKIEFSSWWNIPFLFNPLKMSFFCTGLHIRDESVEKHVIVLSYSWYRHVQPPFYVYSVSNLSRKIRKVIEILLKSVAAIFWMWPTFRLGIKQSYLCLAREKRLRRTNFTKLYKIFEIFGRVFKYLESRSWPKSSYD